jgi:hypothetical protein
MWIVLGIVAAYYVLVPVATWMRRRPLGGTDEPQWTLDQLPIGPEALAYLESTQTALERAGFGPPTRLSTVSGSVVAHLWLLVQRDERTVATVSALSLRGGQIRCSLVFRSHMADGRVVLTTNQLSGRRYPSMPYMDGLLFAAVREPRALWEMHQRRIHGQDALRAIADGDIAAYVNREARRIREGLIAMRYVHATPEGSERITLRGAVLIWWRRLFPWKQLNDWRDARAAAAFSG